MIMSDRRKTKAQLLREMGFKLDGVEQRRRSPLQFVPI